jgi:hypothetical protein
MGIALNQFVMNDVIQRAKAKGIEPTIFVSIDDSLTQKDKGTTALEAVAWFHDHNASTKKKSVYSNGATHISCRVQVGEYSYTFAWRMYLRQKTVRRLNRKRPIGERLKFKSKYRLAREMLIELKSFISRRHPRDNNPKYYLCTDLSLSPQTLLNWYQKRWPIEVDYWYLKQRLGLGDFRLHSYEAIHKWYSVVHLALTFLQWQLYEARSRGEPLNSVADVIQLHRQHHAREVLLAACREAIASGTVEAVVERFIYNPSQVAA